MAFTKRVVCAISLIAVLALCGCPEEIDLEDVLEDVEIVINDQYAPIQVVDPRDAFLEEEIIDVTGEVIIDADVEIITDVSTDIFVEDIPDLTVLGFENLTGDDIFIEYFADGEFQGVFVFEGELLLLEYPCLLDVELFTEYHFDIFTGELVEIFDLEGALFLNPEDFVCGEVIIFTFDPFAIEVTIDRIDLLP